MATKRVTREYKLFQRAAGKEDLPFVKEPEVVGNNMHKWRFKMCSFDDDLPGGRQLNADLACLQSRYGQGHLLMEVEFPADYPHKPFFLRVVSPRCQMYTGHVTAGGSICLEALTTSGTPGSWQPSYTLESLLHTIVLNMIDCPSVFVQTPTGPGGLSGPLRLDFNCGNPLAEYSPAEAQSAFQRTFQNHLRVGWGGPAPATTAPAPAPLAPAAPAAGAASMSMPTAAASTLRSTRLRAAQPIRAATAAGQAAASAGRNPVPPLSLLPPALPAAAQAFPLPTLLQPPAPSPLAPVPQPPASTAPRVIDLSDDSRPSARQIPILDLTTPHPAASTLGASTNDAAAAAAAAPSTSAAAAAATAAADRKLRKRPHSAGTGAAAGAAGAGAAAGPSRQVCINLQDSDDDCVVLLDDVPPSPPRRQRQRRQQQQQQQEEAAQPAVPQNVVQVQVQYPDYWDLGRLPSLSEPPAVITLPHQAATGPPTAPGPQVPVGCPLEAAAAAKGVPEQMVEELVLQGVNRKDALAAFLMGVEGGGGWDPVAAGLEVFECLRRGGAARVWQDRQQRKGVQEAQQQDKLQREAAEVMRRLLTVQAASHMGPQQQLPPKVVAVQRVQNPHLWQAYFLRRSQLAALGGTAGANEQLLFHGASAESVEAIVTEGFDIRLASMGGAFGAGTYFASCVATAATYSSLKHGLPAPAAATAATTASVLAHLPAGGRRLILARVALGRQAPGAGGMRRPPAGADSVSGKLVGGVDAHVVFDNHQAYPEYVITLAP